MNIAMRTHILMQAFRIAAETAQGGASGNTPPPILSGEALEDAGTIGQDLAQAAKDADAPVDTEEAIAKRKELLAAEEAKARKIANDGTAMPDELVGLAQREIKECWREFAERGGVWDLQQKVRGKLQNISGHILSIAKACAQHAYTRCEDDVDADYVKLANAMFRNAMAQAELHLRGTLDLADDDAEAKLEAFLKGSWNVYKSQVKTSLDAGFDPRDYDSIYGMTKAAAEAKKQRSTGTRTDAQPESASAAEEGEDGEEGEEEEQDEGEAAEIAARHSPKIHGALILLMRAVEAADQIQYEDKIVAVLNLATREINRLTLQPKETENHQLETPPQAAVQA